jgi:hypothetical protein
MRQCLVSCGSRASVFVRSSSGSSKVQTATLLCDWSYSLYTGLLDKKNFNPLILFTKYKVHDIKIISLESSFKYEFNDIIFMSYILYFLTKINSQRFS